LTKIVISREQIHRLQGSVAGWQVIKDHIAGVELELPCAVTVDRRGSLQHVFAPDRSPQLALAVQIPQGATIDCKVTNITRRVTVMDIRKNIDIGLNLDIADLAQIVDRELGEAEGVEKTA